MRKTLFIIIIGIIVALFPLLAFPPRIERWVLLIIGLVIVIFGFYERTIMKEKRVRKTFAPTTHQESHSEHLEEEAPDLHKHHIPHVSSDSQEAQ
ncbi:hypothetical protein H6776_02375 [Candidatus Nomurabacteria bacterium]|nr:hypothetical protein [Candidatus Nomurabacteria bacterium]